MGERQKRGPYRPWTTKERGTLKECYRAGMPAAQIAEKLGRSCTAVVSAKQRLGIKRDIGGNEKW